MCKKNCFSYSFSHVSLKIIFRHQVFWGKKSCFNKQERFVCYNQLLRVTYYECEQMIFQTEKQLIVETNSHKRRLFAHELSLNTKYTQKYIWVEREISRCIGYAKSKQHAWSEWYSFCLRQNISVCIRESDQKREENDSQYCAVSNRKHRRLKYTQKRSPYWW